MKRLEFLKTTTLAAAGTLWLPNFLPHQTTTFTPLRNGVGIFSMRGGTIGWFTSDDAIVAIDSQYPDTAGEFLNGIGEFGGGPEKILFNTHHHGDHTGGNKLFEDDDYHIIAHENVPGLQRQAAMANDNEANQAYAQTTFNDSHTLTIGNETITAKYYGRAHTNGDVVIWFENANIAHMGDLIFNRLYPFIDRNSGALISGWIDLLESVYAKSDSDTIFIYGHANPEFGVTGNRDDLMVMRDYFTKLLEHTQHAIQSGKSREEIIQLDEFEEFSEFDRLGDFLALPPNLDAAYRELTEAG